jgi:hypothetical protein
VVDVDEVVQELRPSDDAADFICAAFGKLDKHLEDILPGTAREQAPFVLVLNKSDLLDEHTSTALGRLCAQINERTAGDEANSSTLSKGSSQETLQYLKERAARWSGRLMGVWLISCDSSEGQEFVLGSVRGLVQQHFCTSAADLAAGEDVAFSRARHRQHLRLCAEALERCLGLAAGE